MDPPQVENEASTESVATDGTSAMQPEESSALSVDEPAASVEEEAQASTSQRSSPSEEQLYHLKWIQWKGKKTPIVTQNENGPCPLIAILNVLILKGRLTLPLLVDVATSKQLMDYLGNCILESIPKNFSEVGQLNYEQNMHDAMAVLPKLQTGIDVNVKFTGVSDFEYTPELIVFDLLHIPIYHGWLCDPQVTEMMAAVGSCSYNQLVEKIINDKCSNQDKVVAEALIAESFLESTASQLTYHGLCELNLVMKDGELSILFRNNHFITLYKHKNELLQLLTDQGFLNESNVVWETLNNIEGDGHFVDNTFVTVQAKGAVEDDYLVALNMTMSQGPPVDPQLTANDEALANQLQQEEQERVAAANQRTASPKSNNNNSRTGSERESRRNSNGCVCL